MRTDTLSALRRALADRLKAAGIPAAEVEARALLQAATGLDGLGLIRHGEEAPASGVAQKAEAMVRRRLAGEPLARILGHKEFWSLSFALGPQTLVPRPDTETVVEATLAAFAGREPPARVLDLGTGSGAILAALLSEWPGTYGVGVDISEDAARIARDNLARSCGDKRAGVVVGAWGEALGGRFGLVVSNPPYIRSGDLLHLDTEVKDFDPVLALDGGPDGLTAYQALARAAPYLLEPKGVLVLELGMGQEEAVAGLLQEAGLRVEGPARRDLAGIPRALVARAGT